MNAQMEHGYIVDVFGGDRPGILASVSRAVTAVGGSIESARKTVVDGNFTMIMTMKLPGRWGPTQLAESLRREGSPDWEHAVMAQPPTAHEEPVSAQRTRRFVVTVWGEDRPGVAKGLDMCLAARGILMADLCGEWDGEEFALVAHIDVPTDIALDSLQIDLEKLEKDFDCDVKLQELDVFLDWDAMSHADLAQTWRRVLVASLTT
jgi:glycine cleavage system transcriptional repressor